MRFTEPQGHTEEPPVPPRRSTRSTAPPPYTPIYSSYGFIILSSSEEERLSRLEKRLVPNVKFDDQELFSLGFGTDIYYMFGHLILQRSIGRHPQGVRLGNLDDHCTYP
jgi:hypothetical protein